MTNDLTKQSFRNSTSCLSNSQFQVPKVLKDKLSQNTQVSQQHDKQPQFKTEIAGKLQDSQNYGQ